MIHNDGKFYCEECNTELKLNGKHDAHYCTKCDIWAEKNCGDKNCTFCNNRPDKPSEATEEVNERIIY